MEVFRGKANNEEVKKKAIFIWESSRMDGFQAIFYKSQWDVVGDSFCSLIRSIFGDLSKISDLDETIVALIPKVEVVVNIK